VNLSGRRLHADRIVNPGADGRPHAPEEGNIVAGQIVMENAYGDVGGHVGIHGLVHRKAVAISGVPTAVGVLGLAHPFVGPLGLLPVTGNGQAHGGLHMIPGVGLPADGPGNFTVRLLDRNDKVRHLLHIHAGFRRCGR